MVSDRASIFHIYIPWGKTLSLVPKSRSNIKVTVFQKSGCCGRHSCFTNTSCFPWGLSLMPYSCQLFLAHLSTTCSRGAFRVVMCLSCVINNFFKHLLPNCWANLDQTWQEYFLGVPLLKCSRNFIPSKTLVAMATKLNFFSNS